MADAPMPDAADFMDDGHLRPRLRPRRHVRALSATAHFCAVSGGGPPPPPSPPLSHALAATVTASTTVTATSALTTTSALAATSALSATFALSATAHFCAVSGGGPPPGLPPPPSSLTPIVIFDAVTATSALAATSALTVPFTNYTRFFEAAIQRSRFVLGRSSPVSNQCYTCLLGVPNAILW